MRKFVVAFFLGTALMLGCDDGTTTNPGGTDTNQADTNTGEVGGGDTNVTTDTNPTDTNPQPDTSTPSGAAGGLGLTNGGGQAETSRYKLTLSIGGPLVSSTMSSTNYKLTIGVGAARPAQ